MLVKWQVQLVPVSKEHKYINIIIVITDSRWNLSDCFSAQDWREREMDSFL